MTPTPNPTAEPLKSWEVNSNAWEAFADEEHMTNGIQAAYEAGLRAHGLLSEGAPSEEQIERAAKAIRNTQVGGASYRPAEMPVTSAHREQARAALTAAGVAPQEPCPQPCEHLSAEDAREGRDCREHPCTCPTALTSDREKLVEEARAVVPQAETPQCGPCRRGQHGCCDGNEYLRCDCGHVTPVLPSSGVDEDKLAEVERAAAARALDLAADGIESRRNEPGLVHLDVRYAGYYTGIRSGMESDSKALRARAAEIREGKNDVDD